MTGSNSFWLANPGTDFYNNVIGQSLRFEDGDSSYLLRTPLSAGNSKTLTISMWVKRGNISINAVLLNVFVSASPNNQGLLRFNSSDQLQFTNFSGEYDIVTNRLFRDTTNFFHVLIRVDTTQSTASERIKIYINGTLETSLATSSYPSTQSMDLEWNTTNKHLIGARTDNSTPTPIQRFDGYLAEINLRDGEALGPESFGETKNGVWIAKRYTGSYGTNGFRLTFEATGTGTTAEGTDNSSNMTNIGDDKSGQGHNFSASGLASTDVVNDSPENNFATMLAGLAEPQDYQSYYKGTYTEGNLKVQGSSSGWTNGSSNFGMTSGKWYAECIVNSWVASNYVRIGLRARPARTYDEYFVLGNGTGQLDAAARNGRLASFSTGDVIQFALDLDNNAFYLGVDNTWGNSATATEIANGTTTNAFASGSEVPTGDGHAYFFYAQPHSTGTSITWNFGQDGSFASTLTGGNIGTETDSNGVGAFKYAPPSGFLACCSSNIPELTISPAQDTQATDNFTTVIYNANNQTAQNIDTVGFKPDFLWFKQRDRSDAHSLYDSSRGIGPVLRLDTFTEYSNNTLVTAFRPLGFALGTDTNAWVNYQTDSMVAWCWKGNGGTPVSNTQGSLTCNVQANADAGFSIVTWTGDGNASVTLGHGLNAKPELIIYKGRENSYSWPTWFKTFGTSTGSFIDTSNQPGSFARVKSEPTTTVIPNAELNYTNTNGEGSIAYVFHSVEGYSKIGSYTGNGSSDGVFVYLGFRPAWIITKKVSGSGNWYINDSARSPSNSTDLFGGNLYADLQNDESGNGMDMLSNGFKIRNTDGSQNTSGGTYLYMAFAEQPFKFSNAK